MNHFADIVIAGGGPVGAALALALRETGLSVTVLEARAQSSDRRPLVLSYGSRLILERLGVWPHMPSATPINRIHVSQRGAFGRSVLSAAEIGVADLGYVFDYINIFSEFRDAARRCAEYCDGARATAIDYSDGIPAVEYVSAEGENHRLSARLVVIADGGAMTGLTPQRVTDYHQHALTALIGTDRPHQHTAYERFTKEGPLAMLPFGDQFAMVWTMSEARAADLHEAEPTAFLAQLQEAFGRRAGRFTTVVQRARYPLALKVASQVTGRGVIAVGNAAQALHPVAGQGFNLGLRDVWELAQIVRTTAVHDIGSENMLRAYRKRRRIDRRAGVAVTDGLVRLFSNDFLPLAAARGAGMTLLSCMPPVRDYFARRMMFGVRG